MYKTPNAAISALVFATHDPACRRKATVFRGTTKTRNYAVSHQSKLCRLSHPLLACANFFSSRKAIPIPNQALESRLAFIVTKEVIVMKLSKSVFVIAVAAMSALFAGLASARGPYARSLSQVDSIWVDSNICMASLSDEASEHGFLQSGSPRSADAILEVNVHQLDANVGNSARYSAILRGDDGRVLFSTSGRESSISQRELCADIGDDIFDRIESRRG